MMEFTKVLYELFINKGLSLSQSILIMSQKPKKHYSERAAISIYNSLVNGSLFSNALRTCKEITFDNVYISFIQLAEKNGDLKSTVSYLNEKLKRDAENKKKLVNALIYPLFVFIISIAACIFIGNYTKTSDLMLLCKFIFLFIIFCGIVIFLIIKILGTNTLCEAFTAVDFLLRKGIELSEAVECAVQIAGPSSKIGMIFMNAKLRILYGMNLQSAFKELKLEEAFYYADCCGNPDDLFGKIASYLQKKTENIRAMCLRLVEPFFIFITGVFLLMLLITFFMPIINDVSWI